GRATHYTPSADHCGTSSSSSDFVVAIGYNLYMSNDVTSRGVSEYCGKTLTATYNGKSVTAKIVDSCASCSDEQIDFSPVAFQQLADLDVGVLQVEWSFD
ncbi:RlpA-like double-psi beta-barrel domain-containing protein ASCRUDRAFT_34082, partial [Ascoidea rubescens DSM 1968]